MDDARTGGPGYDESAPKERVGIDVNEDLLRLARSRTDDLSRTIEGLLADWARRGVPGPDDAEHRRRVVESWNAFDEKHGRFAEEWATAFMPER